jgi:dipeptidyl aminopeptidase/acylaminoacyl peptidase
MMQKDIRSSVLYREAEALYTAIRRPGEALISDAAEVHAAPDGRHVAFAGTVIEALEGVSPTRVCETDLQSGRTRVLTSGPNTDRLPKYSPDGRRIAFLSDRHRLGDFQLCFLDSATGAVSFQPHVEGWVEYFHWSPDGERILLGVAGHGADVAGAQGAIASKPSTQSLPSWMPHVQSGDERHRRRSVWMYELKTQSVRQVSKASSNVWDTAWAGDRHFVAVVSSAPDEGSWFGAQLFVIALDSGESRLLHAPGDQIASPAADPSGTWLAVCEGLCSDRGIMAGELRVIEIGSGTARDVDTRGVNVTTLEWRSGNHLLLAGVRGYETVVGLYDAHTDAFSELWTSKEISAAGHFIALSGLGFAGDCVLVGEGFFRAPELAVIRAGEYRSVKSFDVGYSGAAQKIGAVDLVEWSAPDGLAIQGWLLRPASGAPHPVVLNVHGGPVSNWRPVWLGRPRTLPIFMLLRAGYAVLLPNPRGSSGRGQAFSRQVLGDLGGADTADHLSGLDHLVRLGKADAERLGVMGISYGGFMTAWLVTRSTRFRAAVAVAPISNHVTQHLISNIPQFVRSFVGDTYTDPAGKYFSRSPVFHAAGVRTPTLNICGALDRCTPPEEALQFHNALLENGVRSVLVVYPEEGHGVKAFPAAIDYAARVVGWFDEHMRARGESCAK